MLAAHHAAELACQVGGGARDLRHAGDAAGLLEREQRAHVQAAGAGVRVVGGYRAVLGAQALDGGDVLGQMLDRHRDILDARNRLGVALDTHQEAQPRLAHRPDIGLLLRVVGAQHLALGHEAGRA